MQSYEYHENPPCLTISVANWKVIQAHEEPLAKQKGDTTE